MPDPTTSAKYLSVTINGTALKGVQEVNVTDGGDVLDRTTADDNGYTSTDTGCDDCEISIRGLYKISQGPLPTLQRGTILTNVVTHSNTNYTGTGYTLPEAIVTNFQCSKQVRGQRTFNVTIKNRGIFTRPSV